MAAMSSIPAFLKYVAETARLPTTMPERTSDSQDISEMTYSAYTGPLNARFCKILLLCAAVNTTLTVSVMDACRGAEGDATTICRRAFRGERP
jgi:hypothetical protein